MINAYTILVFIILVLAFFMHGNMRDNGRYIWISCAGMFFIMGFREATKIGNDSSTSYYYHFLNMPNRTWENVIYNDGDLYNVGFRCLMKAVSDITNNNYQIFVILISAFVMISVGKMIQRFSVSPVQSFCYFWGLLYYIQFFSIEKQAIAMSILMFAFSAVIDNKMFRFIFLVILASLFHFPALIFLPAYWIAKMNLDKSYLILLGITLAFTFMFRNKLINLMMNAYGDDESKISMDGITFLSNKAIIMIIIIVAAIILRPPTRSDRVFRILLMYMGIAAVLQTFCGYSNIFERLADYYFIYAIIFIPLVFEDRYNVKRILPENMEYTVKRVSPYIFGIFGIYRFAMYFTGGEMAYYIPYVFCFGN